MKNHLRSVIKQVAEASEDVAATSQQLTASSETTTYATEQISQSISQITTNTQSQVSFSEDSSIIVSQISNSIIEITENIESVANSIHSATQKAENGNEIVNNAMEQMRFIHEQSNQLERIVHSLGSRSNEIGQIVSLITDIAGQTNLLALNAAIEAARAGEHGKGFAVVASEVRKLAEQSGEAAGKISHIIQEIQDETTTAVQSTVEGIANVNKGIELVNTAGQSFQDILISVKEVQSQTSNVSNTAKQIKDDSGNMVPSIREIVEGAIAISNNIQNVAASTKDQTEAIKEVSVASSKLTDMALKLQENISTFKI
ncbi:methyl-accepting chemotaxis protein [Bacillus sp. CGMCC 1.16607]|uniref:methyl-accepting chemotaxis protein n=1 Tax=Bacillus sp. CGMCC 1.16607 TaxID=3351842 RepID=UPI0036357987